MTDLSKSLDIRMSDDPDAALDLVVYVGEDGQIDHVLNGNGNQTLLIQDLVLRTEKRSIGGHRLVADVEVAVLRSGTDLVVPTYRSVRINGSAPLAVQMIRHHGWPVKS